MRAGNHTGFATQPNLIALPDHITFFDCDLVKMTIDGGEAVVMANFNHFANTVIVIAGAGNNAVGCGLNRSPHIGPQIQSGMKLTDLLDRMYTIAIITGDPFIWNRCAPRYAA